MRAKGANTETRAEVVASGTVRVAIIATRKVDEDNCRWIEIATKGKRNGAEFSDVQKLLVSELSLGRNENPLAKVAKSWHRSSTIADNTILGPMDLDGDSAKYFFSTLRQYLHGPFDKPESLAKARITSKLGERECAGITASEHTDDLTRRTASDSKYTLRLHKDAPFGVVTWEHDVTATAGDQVLSTMTTTLKLSDFGKGAKSEMPDSN